MRDFELIFVTREVSDDKADELMSEVDAFVGGHGDLTLVTITSPGESALKAAHGALLRLRRFGIQALRLYDDLVTRNQIANRIGKTAQAVGYWTRGERKSGFPQPYVLAAGGLWRWQEVDAWLAEEDHEYAKSRPPLSYPTAAEVDEINVWLRFVGHELIWSGSWTAMLAPEVSLNTFRLGLALGLDPEDKSASARCFQPLISPSSRLVHWSHTSTVGSAAPRLR